MALRTSLFPGVVLLVVLVMGAAGISGSSAAVFAEPEHPDVLAFSPQAVRSDEFVVRTPYVVGQAERGFARVQPQGVGAHDLSVLYDLPTDDWSMAFRPHLWAYRLLPVENAFALEWWGVGALILVAAYAFLLALTDDLWWSVTGALMLWGSPFLHWWYLPGNLNAVGLLLAAAAALVWSVRARSPRGSWLLAGLSGYLGACWALVLYPGFQVPAALVIGAPTLAAVVGLVRSGSTSWRSAGSRVGAAGALAAGVVGTFVVVKRDLLEIISGTEYPGGRRSAGGDGGLAHLASGAFAWLDVHDEVGMIGQVFTNKSEASSFLLLGLAVALAVPLVWRHRAASPMERMALTGTLVVLAVLLLHAYVGLPSVLGQVTGLDRSPGGRALIGIGLGSVLVVVLVGRGLSSGSIGRPTRVAAAAIAGAATVAAVVVTGTKLHDGGAHLGGAAIAITAAVAGAVVAAFFFHPRWATAATAVIGVAVSFPVNPLYRGLEPLTEPSILPAIRQAEAEAPTGTPATWLITDPLSAPLLTAAGIPNASAVNFYPDAAAWSALDPTGASREVWNRYAHTRWTLLPAHDGVTFSSPQVDVVEITLDPCGRELTALGVGFIASPTAIDASCLRPAGTTVGPRLQPLHLYVRSTR